MKKSRVYVAYEADQYQYPVYSGGLRDFCVYMGVSEAVVYKAVKTKNRVIKTKRGKFGVDRLECLVDEWEEGDE